MLCLGRKIGDRIFIGDNVVLTVLAIMPGKVRLGISAPPDVKILRDDIKPEHRAKAESR
jgi:carbon storage regulator CsrA